jgi:putative NADH-flavin reductase
MTAGGVFSEDDEMRLFILGATGGIGKQLVEQALTRGHRVTAFVRSPEKIGRAHERLSILGGDPLDVEQLRRALPDHDVVLSAIGPRGRSEHGVHRDLARSLVPSMESVAVRRLVVVSSAFLFSDAVAPALLGRLFFHDVVKDAAEMERIIVASSLEWTIVRPPRLTDGSRTDHYRIKDSRLPGFGFTVSRADIAHFMLGEVQANRHLHRVVGVCN